MSCISEPNMIARRHALSLAWAAVFLVSLLIVLAPLSARASIPVNNLLKISIRPHGSFTRISLGMQNQPNYEVIGLPGGKVRVSLPDTDGPLLKKYRRYSDSRMGGVIISRRNNGLLLTFRIASGHAWRDVTMDGLNAITLDVGRQFGAPQAVTHLPGREKIWNGVGKLVRDFDPPLKSEFPVIPTDRQILSGLLDKDSQETFMAAEAALYKGNLSEAEELFLRFSTYQSAIRSLALFRLGETFYKLQKFPQALAAFREAERLWPAYLNYNPGVTFYYGDSIARGGDLTAARGMLTALISRLAEKKIAPVLLVRLADILTRQGHEQEALAIYRTVAANFRDNKACWMAALRLNDRDFLAATPWNYHRLSDSYLDISRQSSDIDLREESNFKYVLLESLHGESAEALRQIVQFQKKFPRGVYTAVCRNIREVMVAQAYRQPEWSKDPSGLIRFVEEHQDYLSGCIEQPDFLPKVAKSYESAGRPIELVKIFSFLLGRQWASTGAPYMYEVVADNCELLGDVDNAEKNLRAFLKKFPSHTRARPVLERLGGLLYGEGKYQESRDSLQWLLNKGERASMVESYYFLGRSLWSLKQYAQASRSMDLYLGGGSKSAKLLPDAYYVAVSAREAVGDRKGALKTLEAGLARPELATREELLYKAGELNLNEGRKSQARAYFEKVTRNGKDPDWTKLARQALESLDAKSESGAAK